jgi:predicted ATPase
MATPITNRNLFVITGAPGAGKTALLRELEQRGYRCVEEVARQIIQEQVRDRGDALPWANTARYADLMLSRSIESYLAHTPAAEITFVDRGIPDYFGYARLIGLVDADKMKLACDRHRYNGRAFLAPAWREIYHTDNERKQTFEEAVAVQHMCAAIYEECGYECIELPKVDVQERAAFVLANLR